MEKLVCFTTQCYDIPPGWFGKRFVLNLLVDIDSIRGRKWNFEHVIFFQTVILQRVQIVNNTKNIHAQTDARLNSWNCRAFDELICDSYAATAVYLGGGCGDKLLSSINVHSQTLLYVVNYEKPSDSFVNGIRGSFSTQ